MENKVIIENNDNAKECYGHRYGSYTIEITKEELKALKKGKCLATNDSEYSTFIVLKN